ncbi:NAD(P)-dependent dehydrogenase, short-chain alcohol dehydrogenase family [Colwellia chukchiensis]|uniref:NAD(P)-dependent dehydrogenase, short-chain alcohol dehydrogenase family n=1 Tax=Colwellia chukchiensis TaxID=641665 RepID=A0A1H7SVK5_9GAMM|nr:SDR family NAD(P)-dependent oxidoreductase [Colwellia chukchiensis]SEL76682.1 NAD(P)-dependent dehydrogenase, short-chain alcohol dehydrogenase family [Colwellia chukchiensis]
MQRQQVLILGANSTIAQALVTELLNAAEPVHITLISRDLSAYEQQNSARLTKILLSDYQESSIEKAVLTLTQTTAPTFSQVYIFHGLLHNETVSPEKRIEDFSAKSFTTILSANTVTPLLWIKALTPIITGDQPCKLVVFSARVGSIADNRLGGWYSYRASKAALNMMLKNVAIEFSRRAKNIKVIAFHPGTTNTGLSKPFQKNVAKGKLFTAQFVAQQVIKIVAKQVLNHKLSFLDWQGKNINW